MTADGARLDALLAQELQAHPLGARVIEAARDQGTPLHDPGALAQVIARLDSRAGFDAEGAVPLILILAGLLDRLATHDADPGAGVQDDIRAED